MLTNERKKEYLERQSEEMELNFFKNEIAMDLYNARIEAAKADGKNDMVRQYEAQIEEAQNADKGNKLYFDILTEKLSKM
jgi:hypothetical protein